MQDLGPHPMYIGDRKPIVGFEPTTDKDVIDLGIECDESLSDRSFADDILFDDTISVIDALILTEFDDSWTDEERRSETETEENSSNCEEKLSNCEESEYFSFQSDQNESGYAESESSLHPKSIDSESIQSESIMSESDQSEKATSELNQSDSTFHQKIIASDQSECQEFHKVMPPAPFNSNQTESDSDSNQIESDSNESDFDSNESDSNLIESKTDPKLAFQIISKTEEIIDRYEKVIVLENNIETELKLSLKMIALATI